MNETEIKMFLVFLQIMTSFPSPGQELPPPYPLDDDCGAVFRGPPPNYYPSTESGNEALENALRELEECIVDLESLDRMARQSAPQRILCWCCPS